MWMTKPRFNADGEAELAKLLASYNGDSASLLVVDMLMTMDESACRSVPIDISAVHWFYNRARALGVLDE